MNLPEVRCSLGAHVRQATGAETFSHCLFFSFAVLFPPSYLSFPHSHSRILHLTSLFLISSLSLLACLTCPLHCHSPIITLVSYISRSRPLLSIPFSHFLPLSTTFSHLPFSLTMSPFHYHFSILLSGWWLVSPLLCLSVSLLISFSSFLVLSYCCCSRFCGGADRE